MICIQNKGRLGNQFFIYAFAKKLQNQYPEQKIVIDTSEITSFKFDNDLLNFKIKDIEFVDSSKTKVKKNIMQKVITRLYIYIKRNMTPKELYIHENKYKKFYNHFGLVFCENGYIDFPKLKNKNIFFNGFFQSVKYFSDVEKDIKEDLTTFHKSPEKNKDLMETIQNNESICISIRRGDYVNHPIHDICTIDYYLKAIDTIAALVKNPVFIAFSDDIKWVKENIQFNYPVFYEDGNDEVYEKLNLMSNCKHFILSNSTFSWWSWYLSENKNKKVVSPNRWFNKDIPCDLYDDSWIKINV